MQRLVTPQMNWESLLQIEPGVGKGRMVNETENLMMQVDLLIIVLLVIQTGVRI